MGQKTKGGKAKGKSPANENVLKEVKEQVVETQGPSVDDLFVLLDRHVRADDLKNIVKVADQILAIAPKDVEAKQCKVVALIQSDDVSQALQEIDSSQTPGLNLSFEKAYCLYRLNKLPEALAALKGVERNAYVSQLEALILYRKGELGECITSYEKLFKQHEVNTSVKANIVAAYVSGGRANEVPKVMELLKVAPKDGFELAHNAACALIERKEYSKAEELLLLARRIGQESLIEEDYSEEDVEDELAPISVQLAYLQQVQGRTEEAVESYNTLLKRKPADQPSIAVASNNLIAIRGARDLFDSLKKTDKLLEKRGTGHKLQFAEGLEYRLAAKQKEAISFNRCLLLLHSSKLEQVRDLVSSLVETFPGSVVPKILSASLLLKEGKPAKADELLTQFAEEHPDSATDANLVRAQAAAAAGNHLQAAKFLEMMTTLQHKLGMVATIVMLKERGGNVQAAEAALDEAIDYWDNHMGEEETSSTLETIVQEAAAFKLRHKKMKAAATMFERLRKSSSSLVQTEALNGLVSSTAYIDPTKAESYEKQLPPLPGLSSLNIEALERSAPSTVSVKRGRVAEEGAERTGEEKLETVKPKKKRKRKPLYPKGFNPANPGPPPDPERWLPKRERSSFRPKKKDKRNVQIRGAQGSVVRDKLGDVGVHGGNGSSSLPLKSGSSNTTVATEAPKPPPASHKGKKKGRH